TPRCSTTIFLTRSATSLITFTSTSGLNFAVGSGRLRPHLYDPCQLPQAERRRFPPPKVPSHIIVPSGLPIGRSFHVTTRATTGDRVRSWPFRHSHEWFDR